MAVYEREKEQDEGVETNQNRENGRKKTNNQGQRKKG